MENGIESVEKTVSSLKDDVSSLKDDMKQLKEGLWEILVAVRRLEASVGPQDEGVLSINTDPEESNVNVIEHGGMNHHNDPEPTKVEFSALKREALKTEEEFELKNKPALSNSKNESQEEIQSEVFVPMEAKQKKEKEMNSFTTLVSTNLEGNYYLTSAKKDKGRKSKRSCYGGKKYGANRGERCRLLNQFWLAAKEGEGKGNGKNDIWVLGRVKRIKWGRSPILNGEGKIIGPISFTQDYDIINTSS